MNLTPDKKKVLQQIYEKLKVSYFDVDVDVDCRFVIIFSLEANFTSVTCMPIDQFLKNCEVTRLFGVICLILSDERMRVISKFCAYCRRRIEWCFN